MFSELRVLKCSIQTSLDRCQNFSEIIFFDSKEEYISNTKFNTIDIWCKVEHWSIEHFYDITNCFFYPSWNSIAVFTLFSAQPLNTTALHCILFQKLQTKFWNLIRELSQFRLANPKRKQNIIRLQKTNTHFTCGVHFTNAPS